MPEEKNVSYEVEVDLEKLFDASCHLGHKVNLWNPAIKPFLFTKQSGIHIFDLEKTANQIKNVCTYFHDLAQKKKSLLLVATKKQTRGEVEKMAAKYGCMYINHRWLGGFLTNWSQVSTSLKRMLEIEKGLETGKYDKHTKFERNRLEKEKNRLERFFGGLKNLKKIPDCIMLVDIKKEANALKEATVKEISTVAIVDSNCNPNLVDLAIPANDDASSSVLAILEIVLQAYSDGLTTQK
jgi:small subunit ribosomal protein S2